MTAKIPDFRKLKNQCNNLESRISFNLSSSPKNSKVDEELHSALKTKPKSHTRSYDKELLRKAQNEMQLIQKEISFQPSNDSLCVSSESEKSRPASFRLSKLSENIKAKVKVPDPSETIKRLQAIIMEKNRKIEILEEKLLEKHQIAEENAVRLNKTNKILKNNEKDINSFKKDFDERLENYKRIVSKLELENKELYTRIRTMEKDRDGFKEKHKKNKDKLLKFEEIQKQNSELKKKFEDSVKIAESLQTRYENLVESSMIFEERTRDLYKANQVLQENILKLLPDS